MTNDEFGGVAIEEAPATSTDDFGGVAVTDTVDEFGGVAVANTPQEHTGAAERLGRGLLNVPFDVARGVGDSVIRMGGSLAERIRPFSGSPGAVDGTIQEWHDFLGQSHLHVDDPTGEAKGIAENAAEITTGVVKGVGEFVAMGPAGRGIASAAGAVPVVGKIASSPIAQRVLADAATGVLVGSGAEDAAKLGAVSGLAGAASFLPGGRIVQTIAQASIPIAAEAATGKDPLSKESLINAGVQAVFGLLHGGAPKKAVPQIEQAGKLSEEAMSVEPPPEPPSIIQEVKAPVIIEEPQAKGSAPEPATAEPTETKLSEVLSNELPPTPEPIKVEEATPVPPTREGVEATSAPSESPIPAKVEPTTPQQAPKTTGIRNAITDEIADNMGLPKRDTPERYAAEEQLADAQSAIADNPKRGEAIVSELKETPRALDPLENNIMAFEMAARQTEFNAALKAAKESNTLEAKARLESARAAVADAIEVTRATGTVQGRALESRKRIVQQEYELPVMQAEAQIAKGRPLTEAESNEITALHDKIKELQGKLEEASAKTTEKEAVQTLKNLIREEVKSAKMAKKEGRSFLDVLKEGHDKALDNIRKRSGRVSAGVDPTVLADVARIGAYKIAKGLSNLADFTKVMVADIGEWIRPQIDEIFAQSQKLHTKANEAYTAANAKPAAIERVKADAAEGKSVSQSDIYNMAREKVNAGMTKLEDVMEAIRSDLEPIYPGITVREIRDAFSGYGKVRFPSKAEDLAKLRELRRLGQLASAIEDAQSGRQPKKSGSQRDLPTPEILKKMVELRDAMDAAGIETKSPKRDLKSRLSTNKKAIQNRIKEYKRRIAESDYSKPVKADPVTDKELLDLRFQEAKLKEKYQRDLFEDRLKTRTWDKKTWDGAIQALSLSRALKTSFDVSAPLRQGKFIAAAHPIISARALGDMFKSFASEKAAFRAQEQLEARENFRNGNYKTAKLALTDPNSFSPTKMEEDFQSRWGNKVPGVKGSGRAYSTYLNKVRADVFDTMLASWFPEGASKQELKQLGDFINQASGRGSLGQSGEMAGPLLNNIFFSPKFVASRLQLAVGKSLWTRNSKIRKAVAAEYARFVVGMAAYYGILASMQDDKDPAIGMDPRKKGTFMTVRVGDTRYDPLAGLKQIITTASQLATAQKVTDKDKVLDLANPKFGGEDVGEVASRFVRSKFSPGAGLVADIVARKDFLGRPLKLTPDSFEDAISGEGGILANSVLPMTVPQIYDVLKEKGALKGFVPFILTELGEGINTYSDDSSKEYRQQRGNN